MNMESTGPAVYRAINAVQRELAQTGITKNHKNAQQGYNFRGIDDVYNAISPLMAKHGLCIIPRMLTRTCEERQNKSGGALFYVTVEAEFDFIAAEDGSKHTARTFGEAMDSGDKATNKAMSAAYKYAAFQSFAIPTEGDNDADSRTHDVVAKETLSTSIRRAAENAIGIEKVNELAPDRYTIIRGAAANAIALFAKGDAVGAYEEISGIDDTEEKLMLWNHLRPHSALRAAIKRLAANERAMEAIPEAVAKLNESYLQPKEAT